MNIQIERDYAKDIFNNKIKLVEDSWIIQCI